jgi:hypothetical protein
MMGGAPQKQVRIWFLNDIEHDEYPCRKGVSAKSRDPLEEEEPYLSNYLQRRNQHLRVNDAEAFSRLFAAASVTRQALKHGPCFFSIRNCRQARLPVFLMLIPPPFADFFQIKFTNTQKRTCPKDRRATYADAPNIPPFGGL